MKRESINNASEKLSAPRRLESSKAKELAKRFNIAEEEEYFTIASEGGLTKIPKWESMPVVAAERNGKQEFKNIPIEKALEAAIKYPEEDLNQALALLEKEKQNNK